MIRLRARLCRLARARIWQFQFSDRTAARLAAARAAVDSALALDSALPEAHLALGQIDYWGGWTTRRPWPSSGSRAPATRATETSRGRGGWWTQAGAWEQALASLRKAVELLHRSAVKHMDVFEVYLRQRQYVVAEQFVDRGLGLGRNRRSTSSRR